MSAIEDYNSGVFESVLANRWNDAILERIGKLGLNDWLLTSGCIAQSVWKAKYGFPPDHGIIDYDLIYFDPDSSWQAEDDVIRKAADVFPNCRLRSRSETKPAYRSGMRASLASRIRP
ncbi:nucleotidyltransferase family protein [Rhodomicrobium vannielii]|uniref:nucleotidyltransferase family protein n=1 Tax=Rhodomicrobium vannielii TaxID=1069 RepID=UPI001FEEDDB5|nr:nucleotidyltransferase family protein [Rhodomicrobium vannielii]